MTLEKTGGSNPLPKTSNKKGWAAVAGSVSLALTSAPALALKSTHGSEVQTAVASQDTSIRPFHVSIPQSQLDDLRQRVLSTRWPDRETVQDTPQGVRLATIQALVQYWGAQYDSRKVESELNSLPQFTTKIDGVDIYFIHVRSRHPNALPVVITHGWPGSVIEQLKIVGPLTDPTAHGGRAEDAFDVIIPSLPGYTDSALL